VNGLNSPAFIAAEQGYDVWLGNTRGNYHSRRHVTLNPDKDIEYWLHNIFDLVKFDVTAFINHIMKITQRKPEKKDSTSEWNVQNVDSDSINKISIVGHSMGTT
jgi:hypothetical protein